MSSTHHSFDIYLAQEYGIEGAILIHHFQHWCDLNRRKNSNQRDGRSWTYQTRQDLADHFVYWTKDKCRRYVDKLVKRGVLMKGNYNKRNGDNTQWYAFVDESKWLREKPRANLPDPLGPIRPTSDQYAQALPDTKTDTSTLTGALRGEPRAKTPSKSKKKPFSPKIQRAEFVSTSNEEHNRLTADYGDDIILRAYENLSDWKSRQPPAKQRIDDNRAMRKWAIRSVIDEDLKSKETELKKQELKQREERIKRVESEKSQGKHPIQFSYADQCDGKSSVPTHRIRRYTNNGVERDGDK